MKTLLFLKEIIIPKEDKLSNVGVEEKKDSVPTEETTPLIDENKTISLESAKESPLDSEAKDKLIDTTIEPSIDTSEKKRLSQFKPKLTNEIVESGLDNQKRKEIPSEDSNILKQQEAISEQKDISLENKTLPECVIQEPISSELDILDRTIERKPDEDLIIPKEDELSNIEGVKKKDF
uniref:Uncharacterized protein n=1 Tax=Parastrongyloides trichosuri TaxID=131310 RepID=A0A0N5A5W3_PARTI